MHDPLQQLAVGTWPQTSLPWAWQSRTQLAAASRLVVFVPVSATHPQMHPAAHAAGFALSLHSLSMQYAMTSGPPAFSGHWASGTHVPVSSRMNPGTHATT